MSADNANRSFLTLVAVALAPYVLLGVFGCGLLSFLAYRVASDGPSVLTADAGLRPAAAFLAVISAVTVLALRSLWRQHRATRRLVDHVDASRLDSTCAVEAASDRAGLAGHVDLVGSAEAWSFTYGLRRPRVAISAGLVSRALRRGARRRPRP